MNAMNGLLVAALVLVCLSLVTSRQQQRLDFAATERAQAQARRLEQDFQNLTAKQQQLEQTERIERIARLERSMERIPPTRTVFIAQAVPSGGAVSLEPLTAAGSPRAPAPAKPERGAP